MEHLYNWYNEPENQTIYLDKKLLSELIFSCIKKAKAVSQEKRIKELEKHGFTKVSVKKWLYGYTCGGIEIAKLVMICKFLNLDYNSLNDKILAVGQSDKMCKFKTFTRPKFPINLVVPEIGTIIGAQASDASLSSAGWFYYNNKKQLVYKIKEAINLVFGNISTRITLTNSGRGYVLQAPALVARCINRLGIPYGSKVKQNYPLPEIVMKGSQQVQSMYLAQRYSDEGSIRFIKDGRNRWMLFCYQAIDLNPFLSSELFEELKETIIQRGKLKLTPSATKFKEYSKISALKNFKLTEYKPTFLLNDQKLLGNFGIRSYLSLTKVKYYE